MSKPAVVFFRMGILLAGCLCALLAEGLVVMHYRAEAARSSMRVDAAVRELRRLQALHPPPSFEELERSEAACVAAMKVMEGTRSAVLGHPARLQSVPATLGTSGRAEAFFDLARFADGLTELCLAEDIGIPEGMRFGFASHASVAPAADLIPFLLRQSIAIEDLIVALVDAGPTRIESVRRERPAVATSKGARSIRVAPGHETGENASDFFTPDAEASVSRKLGFDGLSFRVGFVGTTASLRHFLNHLAGSDAPWCVVAVEAHSLESADHDLALRTRRPRSEKAEKEFSRLQPLPIRFVVTAEWIHEGGGEENFNQGEVSG